MSKKHVKSPLIYALEPRLLFDGDLGADVASAIVYRDGNNVDDVHEAPAVAPENQRENPRENITFEFHSSRTAIVFIDGGVQDPQTLADAAADVLPDDTQIHILQGDSDGFDQINEILENHDRVDEIHIFGHGKAGEARLGTASLSLETLTTHSDTLAVLKDTLTEDGDILLYGCNIASGEEGGTFIEELAEITAADIAASDDITGAGGDWELEVNTGPIEADVVEASAYQSSLSNPDGVSSMTNVEDRTPGENATQAAGYDYYLNVNAFKHIPNTARVDGHGFISSDSTTNPFVIALEKSNITSLPNSTTNNTLYFDFGVSVGSNGSYDVSSSQRVASYLVALNNNENARPTARNASIQFEHEILGYYADRYSTIGTGSMVAYDRTGTWPGTGDSRVSGISNADFSNSDWFYPTSDSHIQLRWSEGHFQEAQPDPAPVDGNGNTYVDYVWTPDNYTLKMAAQNQTSYTGSGDFIRVITKWYSPPTVTSAADVSGSITELADGHVSENSVSLFEAGHFTISDANNDAVTVSSSLSSTTHGSGSAFGALTAQVSDDTDDGSGQISWTYSVADSALDALGDGDSHTETWVVTVNDGTEDVTQNITITINGTNDAPEVTAIIDQTNEDPNLLSFDLTDSAYASDPEGDSLSVTGTPTITAVDGSNNVVTLPDGTVSLTGNIVTIDPTVFNYLSSSGESVVITVTFDVFDGDNHAEHTHHDHLWRK